MNSVFFLIVKHTFSKGNLMDFNIVIVYKVLAQSLIQFKFNN